MAKSFRKISSHLVYTAMSVSSPMTRSADCGVRRGWITMGTYLDFTGKFEDGKMILSRDAIVNGRDCKQRMVWYDIQEHQFDWNWERSDDGEQTWRALASLST